LDFYYTALAICDYCWGGGENMFDREEQLRDILHEQPELLLEGLPEINPVFCPDAPMLVSLGREIRLLSGPIDNMFIDLNGIVTLVECKLYSNFELKRKIYSQAINYASDLQNMLLHYEGDDFLEEFHRLSTKNETETVFNDLESMIAAISDDETLTGKNLEDWRNQFSNRLKSNIQNGVFRIILACGPKPNFDFHYGNVRNLLRIMNFSESPVSRYDLALMDIRTNKEEYSSKLIWRRYCPLPEIPLIAMSNRNREIGIRKINEAFAALPDWSQEKLNLFENALEKLDRPLITIPNNTGLAIKTSKGRSTYAVIAPSGDSWTVKRHQIRNVEKVHGIISEGKLAEYLDEFPHKVYKGKASSLGGEIYDIEFKMTENTDINSLLDAVTKVLK